MPVPARPKIYHIVHDDKLASIVSDKRLWSDAIMVDRSVGTVIGMGSIKQRRLSLPVSCHEGLNVGDCVPFYFCSRSIMLYVIHCANHPELTYRGGQGPIVHLEADLREVVDWANERDRRWAVSLSNAGARYAQFRTGLAKLREVDWDAVAATDFRSPEIKEAKQAEFLIERSLPWRFIERIGVRSKEIGQRVARALQGAEHRPRIEIRSDWYY